MTTQISAGDFEQAFKDAWPPSKWTGITILVACSGGADSVALLRCMANLAPETTTIKVAHYNHQLRGADSQADEAFVRSLANQLSIECAVGTANIEIASSTAQQSEASLRCDRYAFLEQTASRLGARYIVTAHTADDQAETILHRWCRGAGASGLCGIRNFREIGSDLVLARPMLDIWRENVIAYLEAMQQEFRLDASNNSDRYTRNRIRNCVLPELENVVHPNAKKNIVEASKNIRELQDFIENRAADFLDRWLVVSAGESTLQITALQMIHSALRKEVLRSIWLRANWPIGDMTSEHWGLLSDLISGQNNGHTTNQFARSFPGNVLVRIDGSYIRLKRI